MRFCQSFMTELYRHIGPDTDVPAGDIGVGGRKWATCSASTSASATSSPACSPARAFPSAVLWPAPKPPATACATLPTRCSRPTARASRREGGHLRFRQRGHLRQPEGYPAGGKVIAMSDSNGYIVDENGIDYKVMQEIKEVKRARIKTYLDYVPTAKYVRAARVSGRFPATSPCPAPPRTSCRWRVPRPWWPTAATPWRKAPTCPPPPRPSPTRQAHNVLFAPAKASNAGGVATSGLEMSQNSLRLGWTFEEVDQRLHDIMVTSTRTLPLPPRSTAARGQPGGRRQHRGLPDDRLAMMSQGIV